MTMIKTYKTELEKLQLNYINAKAMHETVKAIEKRVKTRVLAENIFLYDKEYEERREEERILNHGDDYMMNDSDFTRFCKLTHEGYLKEGLDVPNQDTTPDYKTFKELQDAEKKLIKLGIEFTQGKNGITRQDLERMANHWKHREELIELLLRLEL